MIMKLIGVVKRFIAPRSLRYQLLIRSLFILAALLILIGLLQYVLMKNFVYQSKAEAMETQMMSFPKDWFVSPHSGQDYLDRLNNKDKDTSPMMKRPGGPFLFSPDMSLALIGLSGSFTDISGENGTPSPQLTQEEYVHILNNLSQRHHVDYKLVQDVKGSEQLVVYRPIGPPNHPTGMIQMGMVTAPLQDILIRQLLTFIFLSILALGGGVALYVPILRQTLIPLSRIVKVVEQTGAGNLAERFPAHQGQQEIDRLSTSFNGMLERLEASFEAEREAKEQMRRFIADASHELRTPLTSIHGFLEVLLRGAATNHEQLYDALNSMHGESKRINKLVEDLLLLAKLDRAPQLRLKVTPLDALIREMKPQLQMLAGHRNVHFDLTAGVTGQYDPDKIKQVILNLFHNAVQHTDPEKGTISVFLGVADNKVELSVRDNGSGIDHEHLPHVFERFYRSDSSRTRKYGGAGLGLPITRSIVEAHHGTIEVESALGVGSTFSIKLPIG